MTKLADRIEEILPQVEKPTRYMGRELNSITKDLTEVDVKVALAFPDVYDVGMSHLGIKILYHLLNNREDTAAERVYAPWLDMEEKLREEEIPLFSLETKTPVADFDILGFTLQYELSYTNLLNMLDLADISFRSQNRGADEPLVIAGGPCTANLEPIAPFIDAVVLGEAEAVIEELIAVYQSWQQTEQNKENLLEQLADLEGVYVPAFYDVEYNVRGEVVDFSCQKTAAPTIKKRIVEDLDEAFYPEQFIVPYMEIVHDRINLEVARGCTRGCRFCQAGMIYRPVRERSRERIQELADKLVASTGYEEVSLTSLSVSDYRGINSLATDLVEKYAPQKINIALPSMRVDSFSIDVAEEIQKVRKTGLTFAPEAGTQRLRDVINKGVTEEDLMETVTEIFQAGWRRVKLYFMLGLPTETKEDLAGIVRLAKRVAEVGDEIRLNSDNKRRVKVTVSVSTFIPKPHTPFQWAQFNTLDQIQDKLQYLKDNLQGKDLSLDWTEPKLSLLEAAFARGDRRLAEVIEAAWERGARFDGWRKVFDYDFWQEAFQAAGLNLPAYAYRELGLKADLPWDHLQVGVSKEYLRQEYRQAQQEKTTGDCRLSSCQNCGIISSLVPAACCGGELDEWKAED